MSRLQHRLDCDTQTLHQRLGHVSYKNRLRHMIHHRTTADLPPTTLGNLMPCAACATGRAGRQPFRATQPRKTLPGSMLHIDVCSVTPTSRTGHKYFVLIVDDASRHTWTVSNTPEVRGLYRHNSLYIISASTSRLSCEDHSNGPKESSTRIDLFSSVTPTTPLSKYHRGRRHRWMALRSDTSRLR